MTMKLILVTCFLVIFSLVGSVPQSGTFEENRIQRLKRGLWGNEQENDLAHKECPESENELECLTCLDKITDELKKTICSHELVAEVKLSGPPECGSMLITKPIKMDDVNNDTRFTMAANCDNCNKLMDKTVTLLTPSDSFDYMSESFRFGSKTYLIGSKNLAKNCKSVRNVDSNEESKDGQQRETTTEATLETTTTTTTTTMASVGVTPESNDVVDQHDKRNVGNAPNNYGSPSQPNIHAGGYPTINAHGTQGRYEGPRYEFVYPHTQSEYNSPQYSPYHRPPGYLNTGYFMAKSMQYGTGKPPDVNPSYYYTAKNEPYRGPHYEPSPLNQKLNYYPKHTFIRNYTLPSQQNYGSQAMNYSYGSQQSVPYSNKTTKLYSSNPQPMYATPPQQYVNTYSAQPSPVQQSSYQSPHQGYSAPSSAPVSNYGSVPSYGARPSYQSPQLVTNYGSAQPSYGSQNSNYSSAQGYAQTQSYTQPQTYVQPQTYSQPQNYSQSQTYAQPKSYSQPQNYVQPQTYAHPQTYAQSQTYEQPQNYVQPQNYEQPRTYEQPQNYAQHQNYEQPRTYEQPQNYTQPQNYVHPQNYEQPRNYEQPQNYAQHQNYEQPKNYAEPQSYSHPQNYSGQSSYGSHNSNYESQPQSYQTNSYQPVSSYGSAPSYESAPSYGTHSSYESAPSYGPAQSSYNSPSNYSAHHSYAQNSNYEKQRQSYGHNSYSSPMTYQNPIYEQSYTTPQNYGEGYNQPQGYSQLQYTEPQYSRSQYSEPQYSEPQYSRPQYSEPQYSRPQYSEPQYSQRQYSEPQYSHPQYSQPMPYSHPQQQYSVGHSYSSAYSHSNGDYYASSSDKKETIESCPMIKETCPYCTSEVKDIKILCKDQIIFESISTNNSSDSNSNKEVANKCGHFIPKVIKSDQELNSTLFYSIGPKCACQQLNEGSVIILTHIKSLTGPQDPKVGPKFGLSLDNLVTVIKDSVPNRVALNSEIEKC